MRFASASIVFGLLFLFVFGCQQQQETSLTLNADTVSIETYGIPIFIKVNPDSLPHYTPGKSGIKLPVVVKAGTPIIKPNTGIHGIKPGYSNLPQTKEEILKETPAIKSKVPVFLEQGDNTVAGYDNPGFATPFVKEPSKTVVPPKSYKPGSDSLKAPVVVKALSSSIQNQVVTELVEVNPTTGDTLSHPPTPNHSAPIIVPALPPRYKDNAIANLKYFDVDQGMISSYVLSILEDKSGNLWFGTWGGGVSRYDGETFTHFTTEQGLSNNVVRSILEDKSGNLWFGTNGGGVSRYDGETFTHFTTEQGLSNNKVKKFYEDKYGNIWISTSDKITILLHDYIQQWETFFASGGGELSDAKLDEKNDISKSGIVYLSVEQGLSANLTMNVTEDSKGNIWIGCEKGPVRLSPCDKRSLSEAEVSGGNVIKIDSAYYSVKGYTTREGFIGGDVSSNNSVGEDNKGNIWWGSGKMLTKYNPKYDVIDTLAPKIHLKNIRLFFEDVVWSDLASVEFNGLTRWFPIPENLSLPYDQNHITFNYIGINWSRPDKIMYQFMLEGSDKDWSPLTNKTEATFSNLPHGTYTFKVKAVSNDGVWSEVLEYKFEIRPPWWKTWWFRTIYIAFFVLAVFGIYRWRTAALRRRQKELVIEVNKATAEIKEKNEELNHQNEEIAAQRDTVMQQKTELEKLSIVASETDNAVLIMDGEGNFEWANKGFEKLQGCTLDEFSAKHGSNLLKTSSNPKILELVEECIFTGKSVIYQNEMLRPDGKTLFLQTTLTPILSSDGSISRLVAIDSDITKLKETQDQLVESEKMAALGQLIAGVAHEVNTPLGAIRSSV
ncbi:MAG: PAS domain S-box protein, partial [Bacteroidetes bacterium]|nr:PAS domain S-box protein [Bacteroidota bacterium]